MRKKRDGTEMSETEQASQAPQERVTPLDIQEKVFRSQPGLRGYNEREVDEFLDRVTEELARVHAENQRLREQLAAASRASAQAPASVAASAGRLAGTEVGAEYITREREFLRNLAALIQGHAEAVRQDVRRAVESRPAAPSTPPATFPAAAETPVVLPEAKPQLPTEAVPARQLDPVLAGGDQGGSASPDDQTIRELFWGED
jgi:DivIVA domain-containing protein